MTLYHVSENPNIKEFIPMPPPNKEAGVQGDAVWAISDFELPNYLLPRDCPRVCYRDREGKKIIAIEEGWLDRINQTTLYLYELDEAHFFEIDPIAGYWISREVSVPKSVAKIENILDELTGRDLTLKVLPHLHDEKKEAVENTTHFSIIRFRNAKAL